MSFFKIIDDRDHDLALMQKGYGWSTICFLHSLQRDPCSGMCFLFRGTRYKNVRFECDDANVAHTALDDILSLRQVSALVPL